MRKFFSGLWRLVTAPFRLLWWIISFPFRAYRQIREFLTDEPDEHALMDVVSGVVSDKDIRQAMWEQVEDLRKHLLRSIIGLVVAVGISFIFHRTIASITWPNLSWWRTGRDESHRSDRIDRRLHESSSALGYGDFLALHRL